MNLPGNHNVLQFAGSHRLATELGIDDAAIQRALAASRASTGACSTLAMSDCAAASTLVDDYGHHPTEIAATLEALRQGWPDRRLVLVFQPHRYTRTRDLHR